MENLSARSEEQLLEMEDFNDSIVVEMHANEEVAFVIRMAVKTIVENEAKDIIFMKKFQPVTPGSLVFDLVDIILPVAVADLIARKLDITQIEIGAATQSERNVKYRLAADDNARIYSSIGIPYDMVACFFFVHVLLSFIVND